MNVVENLSSYCVGGETELAKVREGEEGEDAVKKLGRHFKQVAPGGQRRRQRPWTTDL